MYLGEDGDAGQGVALGAGYRPQYSEVHGIAVGQGGVAEHFLDQPGDCGIVLDEFRHAGRGPDLAGQHVGQEPEGDGLGPVFAPVGGGVGILVEAGSEGGAVGVFDTRFEVRIEDVGAGEPE